MNKTSDTEQSMVFGQHAISQFQFETRKWSYLELQAIYQSEDFGKVLISIEQKVPPFKRTCQIWIH